VINEMWVRVGQLWTGRVQAL